MENNNQNVRIKKLEYSFNVLINGNYQDVYLRILFKEDGTCVFHEKINNKKSYDVKFSEKQTKYFYSKLEELHIESWPRCYGEGFCDCSNETWYIRLEYTNKKFIEAFKMHGDPYEYEKFKKYINYVINKTYTKIIRTDEVK